MAGLTARVENWRCIKELEIELRPLTILIGKNATGKSSLAYAIYFLAKLPQVEKPNDLLRDLYGSTLEGIVRREGEEARYPVTVRVGDAFFRAEGLNKYENSRRTPWSDAFLLPSTRIALLRLLRPLAGSRGQSQGVGSQASYAGSAGSSIGAFERALFMLLSGMFLEMLKNLEVALPLGAFSDDLSRLYGVRRPRYALDLREVGRIHLSMEIPFILASLIYEDPYIKGLRIPLEQAPDGAVDSVLLRNAVERAPEGSLIVVEEIENEKNPLLLVDLVGELAGQAIERGHTLLITTHNDLVIHSILKTVEEGRVKADDVAVYYLERSREHPWTQARRIKVHEDGTIDEIPHSEEVLAKLF